MKEQEKRLSYKIAVGIV